MNTPICDFISKYTKTDILRLHMPGHKGNKILGFEESDITEIDGADSLYEANGIIKMSESNASHLFGAPTFYSAEGSSQCIKTMLYLACLKSKSKPIIWAGRNVHKSFLSAAVLLGFETRWLLPPNNTSYLSCNIDVEFFKKELEKAEEKPVAVFITSPDYLGNISDIKSLADICHKNDILLLVDNAHGAYLKFLSQSLHPIDLGADMCCDSAHKTLPVLTGGAYLHISQDLSEKFRHEVKSAMSLFGSTSPSYLILQSLDRANKYISDGYKEKLGIFVEELITFKSEIKNKGFLLIENEPLKITIDAKNYGYFGFELAEILKENNIYSEFSDPDFLVLMLTPETGIDGIKKLRNVLFSIEQKEKILSSPPSIKCPERIYSPREAAFREKEVIPISESSGRILANSTVGCPPAVPIIVAGELIDEDIIKCFEYYSIKNCTVIKK